MCGECDDGPEGDHDCGRRLELREQVDEAEPRRIARLLTANIDGPLLGAILLLGGLALPADAAQRKGEATTVRTGKTVTVQATGHGIVIRGTKAIVTAAPYVHEFLVMPSRIEVNGVVLIFPRRMMKIFSPVPSDT